MPTIRKANPGDAKRLARVAERTFREAFGALTAAEEMTVHCRASFGEAVQAGEISNPNMMTLLAEEERALVGFAQLRWDNAPDCISANSAGEIQRLYVLNEWHGRGVAQDLMNACLEEMKIHGSKVVWLGVWEQNPRAIAFYRKFGFMEVGDQVFSLGSKAQRDIIMARATVRGNEVRYRVNDRDEIVFVNDAWDTFAIANLGEHVTATHVLGRPLWEFIADGTTRLLYRDLLARVRGDRPVRFVLRCDSPDCRRLLEMEVSRGQDGLAEFRVWTLAEDARQPQPLLDPDRPRSEELMQVCGWCKKVDVGGRWVEVEEAVSLLGLFERTLLPKVTHGICAECNSRMVATLSDRQMTQVIAIRDETGADVAAITEVTVAAFETLEISSHTEQFIVEALRSAGALTVSLVAEVDGAVVGHIAFSPVAIADGTGDWYGLGPVSVLPKYQRQGIGKALIEEGLARLQALGAKGCCLVGHPQYYRKFGFQNVPGLDLEGVPPEVFFALSFDGRFPRGEVTFHEGFKAE